MKKSSFVLLIWIGDHLYISSNRFDFELVRMNNNTYRPVAVPLADIIIRPHTWLLAAEGQHLVLDTIIVLVIRSSLSLSSYRIPLISSKEIVDAAIAAALCTLAYDIMVLHWYATPATWTY